MQNVLEKTVKCYYNVSDKTYFACQLVEKLYKSGRKGFILTQNDAESALFDKKLWQFRKLSFIPHCRPEHPLAAEASFLVDNQIAFLPEETESDFVIINLCATVAPELLKYPVLVECVTEDEHDRQQGRERIRFYKQNQRTVEHFDMKKAHP